MVRAVTRTGATRPGPQIKKTRGRSPAGTDVAAGGGPPPALSAEETAPTKPPLAASTGKRSSSSAARRGASPLASASAAVTGLPSAIVSFESISRENENDSSGGPVTASGLLGFWPGLFWPPDFAGVQV